MRLSKYFLKCVPLNQLRVAALSPNQALIRLQFNDENQLSLLKFFLRVSALGLGWAVTITLRALAACGSVFKKRTPLYCAVVFIAFVICSCPLISKAQTAESLSRRPSWLPEGSVTVMQRVNPSPQKIFDSDEEAKKWAEDLQAHRVTIQPATDYYMLWFAKNGYVVRACKPAETGEFQSAQIMFVGVCPDYCWIYEEAPGANRVVCVTNVSLEKLNAGPYNGLIETAESFFREFSRFGLFSLNLGSAKFNDAGDGFFTGEMSGGIPVSGNFAQTDQPGGVSFWRLVFTNQVSHAVIESLLAFTNAYEKSCSVRTKSPSSDWTDGLQYLVRTQDPLPDVFNPRTFWMQFTNNSTVLFQYDCANQMLSTRWSDGSIRQFPGGRPVLATSAGSAPLGRIIVLISLLLTTVAFAWYLLRKGRHTGENAV
jgi:hypothetical protein